MKKRFLTNVFAAVAIAGLLLSGSDVIKHSQLITCTIGICMFASGFYGIAAINRS